MVTIEHNADGSAIVILEKFVKVGGEETNRLTIPALRGKHLRKLPLAFGSTTPQWAELASFSAAITLPEGAFDELEWHDAKAVTEGVLVMLGKSQAGGARASAP